MKKIIFALMVVLFVSGFYAPSKAEEEPKPEPVIIKIATIMPKRSYVGKIMDEFNDEVRKKTNNEIGFKFYYDGTMGDEPDVLRKIGLRQLHGAFLSGHGLGQVVPEISINESPFLFRTYAELEYVQKRLAEILDKEFEDNGYIILGWHNIGFVYIFSKKPVGSIDVLRNQKCWLWGNDPMMAACYKAFDVSPVPLSITDVLTSINLNIVDAAPAPPYAAIMLRWSSRFKFVSDIPIASRISAFVIRRHESGPSIWDSISPVNQQKIREIAVVHFQRLSEINRDINEKSIEVLKKDGVKIIHFDELDGIMEERGKKAREIVVGQLYKRELLDHALSILEDYRQNHPSKNFIRIE
jgi:TRAP-type C4-dicarboxylate transport system substrate-binding protein